MHGIVVKTLKHDSVHMTEVRLSLGLFDIFFNICWNRETQQHTEHFVWEELVLLCEIWIFKKHFDRNGGYFKVLIDYIYTLVGYNVLLSYVTVWLCQWSN